MMGKGRFQSRLDRLERGFVPAAGFLGSKRFYRWLHGGYQPTNEELAEAAEAIEQAQPIDAVEQEMAQARKEIEEEKAKQAPVIRYGLKELDDRAGDATDVERN
jgi:hypothetical protein